MAILPFFNIKFTIFHRLKSFEKILRYRSIQIVRIIFADAIRSDLFLQNVLFCSGKGATMGSDSFFPAIRCDAIRRPCACGAHLNSADASGARRSRTLVGGDVHARAPLNHSCALSPGLRCCTRKRRALCVFFRIGSPRRGLFGGRLF